MIVFLPHNMAKKAFEQKTSEFSSVHKYQQIILTIAISVVLVAFVMYGSSVIYEGPIFDMFCPQEKFMKSSFSKEECEQVGGLWQPQMNSDCPRGEKCPTGWCDAQYTCRKGYDQTNKMYERNVFFIVSILGLISLTIGLALKLATASAGISIGGLILIIISIVRYWNEFGKYVRLILLGFLLTALILIAYKKFGKR